MKAAVLEHKRQICVKAVEKPEPSAEEVLVKVSLAGICGSDHTLYQGKFGVPMPVIPGHEAVGIVQATGPRVTHVKTGQRVTIQPNFSCGVCRLCVSGGSNLCASKIRLGVDTNGVFADFVKVPARYLWPVPDNLDDATAVFAEPLAVGVHAMRIMAPSIGENVLIFGAGVMGLLMLQLSAIRKAQVSTLDLSESRLGLARQLGAVRTIDAGIVLSSHESTFDLIYETSGAPGALDSAIRLAAPRGKIVVLGLPGKANPVSTDLVVRKELNIMGSLIYTDEFPESLEMLRGGQIQTGPLTTGRISLEELSTALEEFTSSGRIKTLVEI